MDQILKEIDANEANIAAIEAEIELSQPISELAAPLPTEHYASELSHVSEVDF